MGVVGLCCPTKGRPRKPADGCPNRTTEQPAGERPCDGPGRQGLLGSGKARRGEGKDEREGRDLRNAHGFDPVETRKRDQVPVSSPGP